MRQLAIAGFVLLTMASEGGAEPASGAHFFESAKHDFGTVPRGAQLLHRFIWTNSEKTRVEVTEIRSTCACAAATATPRAVEPGQKGVIEVQVDAKKFIGQKTLHIHVTLSSDQTQVATLEVSAHSRPDIVFNPGEVNFGAVSAGATPTQTIDIEYAGELDWHIEGLINPSKYLEAKHAELYRKPGQVGYRITVALKPDTPACDLKEELQLRTNDPNAKVISVLVEGAIRARLTATPNPLYFGGTRVGQAVTRRIALRGDKPFVITRVEGAPKDLAVTQNSTASNVHVLVLTWTPTAAGELNVQVTFHTDLGSSGAVTVKMQGEVGPE
jgi:hypothetical protein